MSQNLVQNKKNRFQWKSELHLHLTLPESYLLKISMKKNPKIIEERNFCLQNSQKNLVI